MVPSLHLLSLMLLVGLVLECSSTRSSQPKTPEITFERVQMEMLPQDIAEDQSWEIEARLGFMTFEPNPIICLNEDVRVLGRDKSMELGSLSYHMNSQRWELNHVQMHSEQQVQVEHLILDPSLEHGKIVDWEVPLPLPLTVSSHLSWFRARSLSLPPKLFEKLRLQRQHLSRSAQGSSKTPSSPPTGTTDAKVSILKAREAEFFQSAIFARLYMKELSLLGGDWSLNAKFARINEQHRRLHLDDGLFTWGQQQRPFKRGVLNLELAQLNLDGVWLQLP